MEKIEFKNLPDTSTPIDAESLNKIQDNLESEINKTKNEALTESKEAVKEELKKSLGNIIRVEETEEWEIIE
jgi:hypothetical protein|nr:MAG TPA: hypothetical protein [Caudoviricetes sp.]